jgi:hypothetical protein
MERAWKFWALEIDSYGQDVRAGCGDRCVHLLPDRQLFTAASPGGPHEYGDAFALVVGEFDIVAIQ